METSSFSTMKLGSQTIVTSLSVVSISTSKLKHEAKKQQLKGPDNDIAKHFL